VVLTDSLGMGAITGQGLSIPDASVQAVAAGVDMLLVADPGQALATQKRLLQAVQSGEIKQSRIDDAVRHILTLKSSSGLKDFPVKTYSAPDWKADQSLANDAGGKAVTLVRNQASLVPLPGELKKILLIGPPDGWGLYPILLPRLKSSGFNVKLFTYSAPWSSAVQGQSYLTSLPAQANSYDAVIVLTWEAHVNRLKFQDEWQITLVKNLIATNVPTIVVALKSPTDILEFPDVNTYLATYGTTSGQSSALADILVGVRKAAGVIPLPNLP